MDPATIAATVVTLLAPYVKDAGQEMVKTVGEAGVRKIKELLTLLKDRFAGDPAAVQDLSRFEKEPSKRADDLTETIAAKVRADPAFGNEVAQRVNDLGPEIVAVQRFDVLADAKNVDADAMESGKLSATQEGKQGTNVTNVRIGRIG